MGLENISVTISPVFLLPGRGAFGESCSTIDGVVGMLAAIVEEVQIVGTARSLEHWSPCCTEGSQIPAGTKQPPLSVGTFSSGLEKGSARKPRLHDHFPIAHLSNHGLPRFILIATLKGYVHLGREGH